MINEPPIKSLKDKADCLYTVIIMASQRARQINNSGETLLEGFENEKPVSISLHEIASSKIKYRKKETSTIK